MKIKTAVITTLFALALVASASAQDSAQAGFVISLKNGSMVRGRMLARDEASGQLRLTMTETGTGAPKSYAIIAMEDAETISVSSTDADSILVKLFGGSELKCKEFGLNGDVVTVRLGTASRVEVRWDQIESISFAP